MDNIHLQLSEQDVNYILNVLQQRPYQEVCHLINNIVEQGQPQTEAEKEEEVK